MESKCSIGDQIIQPFYKNLINRMKYVHFDFDVFNFEFRGDQQHRRFTGLVPQNKLGPPQNLTNFRDAEKRTT